ncbi:hypothetical protein DCW30_14805 [Streptomyces alfalfae]|uniref:Peptidase inhibitor family I36 protein n=1 Tax=Streptomyces alfalfae TaxID=1642299 RepID=A0A4V1QF33_9ACTN|nr:peptidase inhibitor family I36 protein [Streptomyces alfalfae]AYA15477.1 hypothetical protein D3X13_03780 [Streptomyces fradiae]QQC92558.1 peptidase inhibitor family I36 protein [Streptomyces alfalfae]RXX43858.1 hypothetical protein DCW30_14805 [Streptomyces alfalfae]RZM99964.1 hypothetical protein D4104_09475 [Streptomyces alfalfae]
MRAAIRSALVCTVAAGSFSLLLAGAGSAGAAESADAVCPHSHPAPVCVYDGADFTGLLENRAVWTPQLPAAENDRISSVINDSDYTVIMFADKNYGGESIEIGPHQKWVAPAAWDNRVSSYAMY